MTIQYRGHEFRDYNVPKDANDGKHKLMVLAKENGRVKLVRFGALGYSSNYSDEARRQYRRRHAKEAKQSKLTPGWWSYYFLWSKNSPVYHGTRPERFA